MTNIQHTPCSRIIVSGSQEFPKVLDGIGSANRIEDLLRSVSRSVITECLKKMSESLTVLLKTVELALQSLLTATVAVFINLALNSPLNAVVTGNDS